MLSLTHDQPSYLELMDAKLRSVFESFVANNILNDTVLVIMGDHGQRINRVQYTYRLNFILWSTFPADAWKSECHWCPFVCLPDFEKSFPKTMLILKGISGLLPGTALPKKDNIFSNFDVHQFLVDIVRMRFGEAKKNSTTQGRGVSLFDEIPLNRSCDDASVAANFCTCLVDRSKWKKKKLAEYSRVSIIINKKKVQKSLEALKIWLEHSGYGHCVDIPSSRIVGDLEILGPHPYVRAGLRATTNRTETEAVLKKPKPLEVWSWFLNILVSHLWIYRSDKFAYGQQ